MFYLQKVIVLLETDKYRDDLEILGHTVRTQGMVFYPIVGETAVQVWEKAMKSASKSMGEQSDDEKDADGKEQTDFGNKDDRLTEPQLWITDNACWAQFLIERDQAVLAYLHEENRNQSFSRVRYACEMPSELDGEYLDRVYRRYRQLPWEILETDRCLIRETTEADVEAFYKIYAEPEITRYMEDLFPDVEQELQYVRDYRDKVYDFYGFGMWTVLEKESGEVIGRAGLSYREGYEEPELGFMIAVSRQGKGYAEEVCRAILKYGKEEQGFDAVQALVMPDNVASRGLCEKLGFVSQGNITLNHTEYRFYMLRYREGT